jgi:chromosome segregation ATPase
MLQRHRIPTIFSIYMVDVLCCALGCVILLWQVNHQEAEDKNASLSASLNKLQNRDETILALTSEIDTLKSNLDAGHKRSLALAGELAFIKTALDASHKKYLSISVELDKTRKERDAAAQLALVRKDEFDALKKNHVAAEALLASLRLELTGLQKKSQLTTAQLADKLKAHAELLDEIAKAQARVVLLEKDIDAKKLELLVAGNKLDQQSAKLKDADLRLLRLEKSLADVRMEGRDSLNQLKVADLRVKLLEQELDSRKTQLTDADRRIRDLLGNQDVLSKRLVASAKEVADARLTLSALEVEKLSLLNRAKNLQAAMENRFAGITLTGRRVLFLVDMSGSMELLDENTLDPDKWPLVCETIARIMQSLTDLRQYQVILFSERRLYPLGGDGRWLDYQGPQSAKVAMAAIKAVKPTGGTNMYEGLAEAFRFRAQGLDTIYLLSDGLPNTGDGLPANADKLTETQKTDALAKYVRAKLRQDWNRYVPGQPRVRINTIGFFFESPDVGAFLWALAREHEGNFVGMSK